VHAAPSIFKAYDIRGIVPSTLNEEVARALGRAFGMAALAEGQKTVAVGRDGRLSGPAQWCADAGLVDVGCVIDIGMCTTPMLYFAAPRCAKAASRSPAATTPRITTASRWCWRPRHLRRRDPGPAPHHGSRILAAAAAAASAMPMCWPITARIVGDEAGAPHEDRGGQRQRHCRRLGARHLPRLGCEVIELFSEVDGNFPNHHPDPSKPENLRDVMQALQTPTPSWAWPLTATATAWASSPRTARTSSPTAR
jgi:phosphomannomutase